MILIRQNTINFALNLSLFRLEPSLYRVFHKKRPFAIIGLIEEGLYIYNFSLKRTNLSIPKIFRFKKQEFVHMKKRLQSNIPDCIIFLGFNSDDFSMSNHRCNMKIFIHND